MSRKHFVLIAEAIKTKIHDKEQRQAFAIAIMPALKASNPNFDSYRFMSALMDD